MENTRIRRGNKWIKFSLKFDGVHADMIHSDRVLKLRLGSFVNYFYSRIFDQILRALTDLVEDDSR